MFERIKSVLASATIPPDITKYLSDLNEFAPAAYSVVAPFVATGMNPGGLMAIPNLDQLIELHCVKAWHPRQLAYDSIRHPERMYPEQWVRLGQIMAMAPTLATAAASWPAIPPWYYALQAYRINTVPESTIVDLAWVDQLFTSAGIPPQNRPQIIVECFFATLSEPFSWNRSFDAWHDNRHDQKAQAFAAFLYPYLGLVPGILGGKNAEVRTEAARWFTLYPEFGPPIAQVFDLWSLDPSKSVRQAAVEVIAAMPEPLRSQVLASALSRGSAPNLITVVDYCARLGPGGAALLETALGEGGKKDEMITAALNRSQVASTMPATTLVIPPPPPLDRTPLGSQHVDALQVQIARWAESVQKLVASNPSRWQVERLNTILGMHRGFCESVIQWLNGQRSMPKDARIIPNSAFSNLNLPLPAALRHDMDTHGPRGPAQPQLPRYWLNVVGTNYDLRNLADAAAIIGIKDPIKAVSDLIFGWEGLSRRRSDDVWPFFAEYPLRLDQALGLVGSPSKKDLYGFDEKSVALKILAMFPVLPAKYIPVLAEIATAEARTYRRRAQELLETQPTIVSIAAHTLINTKGEIRAAGAAWLGRIGDHAGIEPLNEALKKEKREQPQAAMLNALSLLGEDISAHLTPEVLGKAAKKGLAAKKPAGMEWVPLAALPECRWADSTPVDPDIITWWTVLSVKLKDPMGAGLIPMYVRLLDQPSQERLGIFILDAWIAHDTRVASDEDCREYAQKNVDSQYASFQRWKKTNPHLAKLTREEVFEDLRREKAGQYLGSAISEKGLLALSAGAPGHHIFTTSMRYIRDHGARRAQVESLIIAAATNDDPAAIQLVLSIARKFRQETVRNKAMELAESIADRHQWSLDELADRTIPTGGFDEAGLLSLDFGSRTFTGRIARSPKTKAFTINLYNPDGKSVAALPKPGVNDDADVAGESRKQLTTSKKELGQIVTLQTSRLFEAMCLGRTWDLPSWKEFLLDHPVMTHLISTLVWRTAEAEWGSSLLFRPTPDKELLNIDDEEITLPDDARIGLAHRAGVTVDQAEAWRRHIKDYEIDQLFSQFESEPPPFLEGASVIDDHLGWLSDTFAIRTRATKRGYSRSPAEDGAWYATYYKDLPGAGFRVYIEFTGNTLPEEQIPAAVERLTFEKNDEEIMLAEVPPILLAESYADYVFIAEAGSFDPEWESKSGF